MRNSSKYNSNVILDIETGPLPMDELSEMIPPFDPESVKTGNLKDPAKIAEKIVEAEAEHKQKYIEKAALDALTGRVLLIGIRFQDGRTLQLWDDDDDEEQVLQDFLSHLELPGGAMARLITFNGAGFDLPFLWRRMWRHRIAPPSEYRSGRYWSDAYHVDLREVWQLGDRMARGSLDAVCKHLRIGGKTGNGLMFFEQWLTDREGALAYNLNDLDLTAELAVRLGVAQFEKPKDEQPHAQEETTPEQPIVPPVYLTPDRLEAQHLGERLRLVYDKDLVAMLTFLSSRCGRPISRLGEVMLQEATEIVTEIDMSMTTAKRWQEAHQ